MQWGMTIIEVLLINRDRMITFLLDFISLLATEMQLHPVLLPIQHLIVVYALISIVVTERKYPHFDARMQSHRSLRRLNSGLPSFRVESPFDQLFNRSDQQIPGRMALPQSGVGNIHRKMIAYLY
jgi:hypothetical protein